MRHVATVNGATPTASRRVLRRWTSPTAMMTWLVLGVILAIAHHMYYGWLDGQVVGNTVRQQWSLRIGNFFAVATAITLKLAMVNACVQYTWLRLRQKYHKLETIDAAFSMMEDVFSLLHAGLYKDMYIGVFLAVLIWSIPIASLFPPATLSVVLDFSSNNSTFDALQPSILEPDPVNQYGRSNEETLTTAYTQPSEVFSTLVKSVAFTGQVTAPQTLTQATNYSYTVDTYMPRFKCKEISGGSVDQALDVARELVFSTSDTITSFDKESFAYTDNYASTEGVDGADDGLLLYLGFASLAGDKLDADELEGFGLPESQVVFSTTTDDFLTDPMRSALTGSVTVVMTTGPSQVKAISCGFYNASFKTEIAFAGSVATTKVLSIEDVSEIHDFGLKSQVPTSYLHYFLEMTKLFVGAMTVQTTVLSFEDENPTIVRMPYSQVGIESTVLATAAGVSDMLSYRADWLEDTEYKGRPSQNKSLADMVNELSVNVSLSLMSSPLLCRTVSVEGDMHAFSTIYQYQPMNLLISYGVAIACSIASVAVGIMACHQNKDSLNTKFSTISAMVQNPELARLLRRPAHGQSGDDDRETKEIRLKLDDYASSGSEKANLMGSNYAETLEQRYIGFVTDSYKD